MASAIIAWLVRSGGSKIVLASIQVAGRDGTICGFLSNLHMPTHSSQSRQTQARRELIASIRGQRRAVGWSIEELAARIGVSKKGAQRLERAALDVSVSVLMRAGMELGLFSQLRRFLRCAGWVGRKSPNSHEIAPVSSTSPSEAARSDQRSQPVIRYSKVTWHNLSRRTSCDLRITVGSDLNSVANMHFRYQDGGGWAEVVPSKGARLCGSLPWATTLAQKTLGSSQVSLAGRWKDPFIAAVFQSRASGWGSGVIRQCHRLGYLAPITGVAGFDFPLHSICSVPDVARAGSFRVQPLGTVCGIQDCFSGLSSTELLPNKSSLEIVQRAVDAVCKGQADQGELGLALVTTTALSGSRPKASCVGLSGELCVAKLHLPGDPVDMVTLEKLTMHLAFFLQLRVALPERLICGGRFVLIYKRFDRDGENRLGVFSARALLGEAAQDHVPPALDHGDMFLLAELIKTHCSGIEDVGLVAFRQLMFLILIGTPGDILRKLVFLEVGGGLVTAPAVGLRIELYAPGSPEAQKASRVRRLSCLKTLITCSSMFGVESSMAKSTLSGQLLMLRSWLSFAKDVQVGMSANEIQILKPTMDAICQDAQAAYATL